MLHCSVHKGRNQPSSVSCTQYEVAKRGLRFESVDWWQWQPPDGHCPFGTAAVHTISVINTGATLGTSLLTTQACRGLGASVIDNTAANM